MNTINGIKKFNTKKYHAILCTKFPEFLKKYTELFTLTRLKGIGLLCGTDWTKLYKNRFFYSRFDHSVGCALITWNFTKDKTQTLASLFHDCATPIFSHAIDFSKGDALKQESTEDGTRQIIMSDRTLLEYLEKDRIDAEKICNYHIFPVADNEIPHLSADRLEYMFPSGMSLCERSSREKPLWTFGEIQKTYSDIEIMKDENGTSELGFKTEKTALNYTKKFIATAKMLQQNENKIALNLLGDIAKLAHNEGIFSKSDFFTLSEKEAFYRLKKYASSGSAENKILVKYINAFLNTKKIIRTEKEPESTQENSFYTVNIEVKKRWIDPLTYKNGKTERISKISSEAARVIEDFLTYRDSAFGTVLL